jgi:hypothetical protein
MKTYGDNDVRVSSMERGGTHRAAIESQARGGRLKCFFSSTFHFHSHSLRISYIAWAAGNVPQMARPGQSEHNTRIPASVVKRTERAECAYGLRTNTCAYLAGDAFDTQGERHEGISPPLVFGRTANTKVWDEYPRFCE